MAIGYSFNTGKGFNIISSSGNTDSTASLDITSTTRFLLQATGSKGDQFQILIPSGSTGEDRDIVAFFITSSGRNPFVGVGTKDPKSSLDVKDVENTATGTRLLLTSARTEDEGAEIGDAAGTINFAIDSSSFNDVFTTGSVASISSRVTALETTDNNTPNVAGNITFNSSPEWIETVNQVAEIGYFHFDNLNPTENSEPGLYVQGQTTIGSGSLWQSQGGDVVFSVYNRNSLSDNTNNLKFRITGSNAVIHSGSLSIGSGSIFLGETYSGTNEVEFVRLRGQDSIKLGQISGGSGNHPLEIYSANTLAAKFDSSQNLGIGTTQTIAPEKLTVEGNISASGDLKVTNGIFSNITASNNISSSGYIMASTFSGSTGNAQAVLGAYNFGYEFLPSFPVTGSALIISSSNLPVNHHNMVKIGDIEMMDFAPTFSSKKVFYINVVDSFLLTSGSEPIDVYGDGPNKLIEHTGDTFKIYSKDIEVATFTSGSTVINNNFVSANKSTLKAANPGTPLQYIAGWQSNPNIGAGVELKTVTASLYTPPPYSLGTFGGKYSWGATHSNERIAHGLVNGPSAGATQNTGEWGTTIIGTPDSTTFNISNYLIQYHGMWSPVGGTPHIKAWGRSSDADFSTSTSMSVSLWSLDSEPSNGFGSSDITLRAQSSFLQGQGNTVDYFGNGWEASGSIRPANCFYFVTFDLAGSIANAAILSANFTIWID